VLGVIGGGAALAGWIAVVGGGVVWARLHAAGIPATQTLAVLPRDLLLVEGLQTLLLPLLIGGGAALLVYYSWRLEYQTVRKIEAAGRKAADEQKRIPHRLPAPLLFLAGLIVTYGGLVVASAAAAVTILIGTLTLAIAEVNWWWPLLAIASAAALAAAAVLIDQLGGTSLARWRVRLLVLAALTPLIGAGVALVLVMKPGAIVAIFLVTIVAAWLTLGALINRGRAGVALTLFGALALWAGALGVLRDLGAKHPKLEVASVERTNKTTVSGFYLGGSGGDVYLASESKSRRVTLIKKDDVALLSFGPAVAVKSAQGSPSTNPTKGGGSNVGGNDSSKKPGGTPDATLRKVVAVAQGTLDGVPVWLEILKPRLGKRLMVLNLRLTNLTAQTPIPRRLVVGNLLDDGIAAGEPADQRETLDGLSLADLDGSRRHVIARDSERRCLCSSQLGRVAVDPGQAIRLYVTFWPAPANGRFELQVPGFGSIPVAAQG
jgi:hypothetical protein